jgi:predicted lipoprotein with Yx(FWY)xxD motif
MNRLTVLLLAAVMALGATAGIAAGASSPSTAAKVGVRSTKLGKILVNGKGVTLYLFLKDKNGKSACSGACATAWPPLLTKGKAQAAGGVSAAKLGTTKRADGTTQVTYNGHPLYTFVMDNNKPGNTTGQGSKAFGAEWYVLGTNGKQIEKANSGRSGY